MMPVCYSGSIRIRRSAADMLQWLVRALPHIGRGEPGFANGTARLRSGRCKDANSRSARTAAASSGPAARRLASVGATHGPIWRRQNL